MLNHSVFIGRLTRDPELQYTKSQKALVSFTLAVNRAFKDVEGEQRADFINCVIWRKGAVNFSKYTHKGSLVAIEGHTQSSSYKNEQGKSVYLTKIVVDKFDLLNPKQSNQENSDNDQTTVSKTSNSELKDGSNSYEDSFLDLNATMNPDNEIEKPFF